MSDPTQPTDGDSEDRQLEPPSADRVARRALALSAVACRGSIEADPAAESLRRDVITWLFSASLEGELEAEERRVLTTPVGSLTQQDAVNASWRSEGLAVLSWALQRGDLPPHDKQIDPAAVATRLGFLESTPAVLGAPRLRSPDELLWASELMFAFHWRMRQFSLDKQPMDFLTLAGKAWFGPLELEGLTFVDNDLSVDGLPLASSPRWREVLSIAMERHQAANWLRGYDPVYSEVSTDT